MFEIFMIIQGRTNKSIIVFHIYFFFKHARLLLKYTLLYLITVFVQTKYAVSLNESFVSSRQTEVILHR
jgi:hypothetical protein